MLNESSLVRESLNFGFSRDRRRSHREVYRNCAATQASVDDKEIMG